jgi:hypothetical protein
VSRETRAGWAQQARDLAGDAGRTRSRSGKTARAATHLQAAADHLEHGRGEQGRRELREARMLLLGHHEDLRSSPLTGPGQECSPQARAKARELGYRADALHHEVLEAQLAEARVQRAPGFTPCDARLIARQIGPRVLASISGGRVTVRETGITLPVDCGYSVTVDLAADDTYVVRRIFRRARKEWIRGERTGVHCEDLSQAAYAASCFRSWSTTEWPRQTG